MSDIFAQNKTLIERLYQRERKTLKQVKEILERDHNFPPAPLSIYETRLRNVLKLRKKFKKKDWPVIYHHYRRRNKKETALYLHGVEYPWTKARREIRRSGARETRIDQEIPLPHGVELRTPSPSLSVLASSPRNADLYIPPSSPTRTSSLLLRQEPSEATSTLNRNMSYENSLGSFADESSTQYTLGGPDIGTQGVVAPSPRMDFISQEVGFNSSSSHGQDAILVVQNEVAASPIRAALSSYIKLRLENLPWQNCRLLLYSMVTGRKVTRLLQKTNGVAFSLIPGDYVSLSGSGLSLARMCDTEFPSTWHLPNTIPVTTLASTKFEVYHFLAQAIYLLSNNLLYYHDVKLVNLIDTLFFHTPRRMIYALFEINHISIQAAWDGLVTVVDMMILDKDIKNGQSWRNIDLHDVILCLATIGMGHPNWVINHDMLFVDAAISFSNYDLLRQLLNAGACPVHTSKQTTAIRLAIGVGSIPCVKILIEQCDLNVRIENSCSHFVKVLQGFSKALSNDWNTPFGFTVLNILDILIDAGADVNSPWSLYGEHLKLLEEAKAPREWYPTCLDWSFFLKDEKLFNQFAARSPSKDATLTRHGVTLAARQGGSILTQYLRSLSLPVAARAEEFLKIIMREQFLHYAIDWDSFDFRVMKSLIDIGVHIHPSDYQNCYSRISALSGLGINDDIIKILYYLFHNGATIGPEAFAKAVPAKGTGMLELLVKYGAEVSKIGGNALLSAARLGNGDAVDWLLGYGVDIKRKIMPSRNEDYETILGKFIMHTLPEDSEVEKYMSMFQHLVDCGAELKQTTSDQYAGGLLQLIADHPYTSKLAHTLLTWLLDQLGVGSRRIPKAELQALFRGALSVPLKIWEIPTERELWWLAFDRLYKSYGPPPRPEPILARLIERHTKDELLQEIIQNSANVNTYGDNRCAARWSYTPLQAAAGTCNYRLVLQLLNLQADANAPPRGTDGRTALQAVCEWQPVSAVERDRQQDIVSLLIKRGANINAAPAYNGLTAIMASAISGNLELTAVLLAHGADPNNYYLDRQISPPQTVLDMSTERCDITNLLLNAGALSSRRGSTGYEGAILDAEREGHHGVAKMIRDHIAKQEELFRMNPELRACHNAILKNMDEQDALGRENELSDEDSYDEADWFSDDTESDSDGIEPRANSLQRF